MLSAAQKKYLAVIYRLSLRGLPVHTTEVSDLLGVSKASTVKMNRRLAEEGCIVKEPYGSIMLTEKGRGTAAQLYADGETLCTFLKDRLGVSAITADADSALMMSCLSSETMAGLLNFIREVSACPNG